MLEELRRVDVVLHENKIHCDFLASIMVRRVPDSFGELQKDFHPQASMSRSPSATLHLSVIEHHRKSTLNPSFRFFQQAPVSNLSSARNGTVGTLLGRHHGVGVPS